MDGLQKALSDFLEPEDADKLARIMAEVLASGQISYEAAGSIIGDDPEDILTLAYSWRLVLPVRAARSGDWEERMLIPRPGETYQMPNVVRCLVEDADKTARWNPEKAIFQVFGNIGDADSDKMPALVERMASEAKGRRITGIQIIRICAGLGLEDRVDPLVSELKACGIMSPKLSSLADASRTGAPIYELNRSLFVGGEGLGGGD